MYIARWIIIPCLIVAMVFMNSPLARGEMNQFWAQARPDILLFMDSLYSAIRKFVAGGDSQKGIEDHAPEVDYDLIITMDRGNFF